jgi:hypothetical protein
MASQQDKEEHFNSHRRLCPDGTCIGIIGSNGRCTVCGSTAPAKSAPPDPAPVADDDLPAGEDAAVADASADDREEGAPAFDPKRRLCDDDACIGIIGSDHRCSVCGKPADG